MSKTPLTGFALGMAILALVSPSADAAEGQAARTAADAAAPLSGFNAPADSAEPDRAAMDFNQAGSRAADLPLDAVSGQATAPLPLSQVARGAKSEIGHVRPSLWELINEIRYGGLPEPASWALMLIGFGMIGGALRGFMIANRRLAGLQPDDAGEDGAEGEA